MYEGKPFSIQLVLEVPWNPRREPPLMGLTPLFLIAEGCMPDGEDTQDSSAR
jgi:hypothetical protein